jgi:uncharacterized protein (DUF58 family)
MRVRWWQASLLSLLVGTLGLATGNVVVEKCSLALMLLLLLALFTRLVRTGRVEGERRLSASVIPWGGALTQHFSLTNASRVRVTRARVIDYATLPEHPRGFVAALPGHRSITWSVTVPCRVRGRYQLGPVEVTTSDLLGLFPAVRQAEAETSVLVLPRWVPLVRCCFSLDGALPGDLPGTRRGEVPPAVAGVRAYQPGDSLARIHWRASARSGTLQSKQFDPEVQTTVWLGLDLDGQVPGEREELLVTATASVAVFALQQGSLQVGLVASGTGPLTLLPERGHRHRQRLLELLAEAHAGGNEPLGERLARLDRYLGPQHVLFLLTAQPAQRWLRGLEQMQQRGLAVRVIFVGPPDGDQAGWPVPQITLPVHLADPARSEELIAFLEEGGRA